MSNDTEKYENVARWLDGESVELTAQEQELLGEFHCDEQAVGDKLSVAVSGTSEDVLRGNLALAMASHRSGLRIVTAPAIRWAAVAAAVLVISTLVVYKVLAPTDAPQGGTYRPRGAAQLARAEDIDFLDTLFAPDASPARAQTDSEDELAEFIEPMFTNETAWAILGAGESATFGPGDNG